jgi:hypothetical protein
VLFCVEPLIKVELNFIDDYVPVNAALAHASYVLSAF